MSDTVEIVDGFEEAAKPLTIIPEGEIEDVIKGLKEQFEAVKADTDFRNQKVAKWRKAMEALASDAPKQHPYKNASNVTIPVTQSITQSLAAQVTGMFVARDPLWNVEPMDTSEAELRKVKVIEKYLNLLLKNPYDIGMDWIKDMAFETILTGGAFPIPSYDVSAWRVKTPEGEDKDVVWHDGPAVRVMPIEKVYYPRGIGDIARLPWIAIERTMTETELKERGARGIYDADAVEKVMASKRTSPTTTEEQEQTAEFGNSGESAGVFDITEIYFFYDVDKTGIPVDLFFTVDFNTGAVLKQQYNTLGARSIVNAKYIHRPRALVGRGTGQMTESLQAEITTTHNLRIDNSKLAGMKMFAVKTGSWRTSKREIFPGAVWEFDTPAEDIRPISIGEVYPSSLQNEQLAWGLAQKAVGLSDTQMGFADATLGSRDTARGQAMRMQRGDNILGSVVEGLKTTISMLGMLVWLHCVANKDRVIARETKAARLTQDELDILKEALEVELAEVPMRLKFVVRTTEAEKTYEQRRMNVMTLSQLYSQYAQQTVPLAMQLYGPQGQQIKQQAPELWNYLGRILVGSGKLMEDIFKFFGTMDVNNYIPDSEKMDQLLDMLGSMAEGMKGIPQMAPEQSPMPGAQAQPGPEQMMMEGGAPGGMPPGMPIQ